MEKKLKNMFDYQRFEKSPELEKIIKETERGYAYKLSDDELFKVNAAGNLYEQSEKEINVAESDDKEDNKK